MATPILSSGTGRARSCIGCRQVKLACDARRTAPQACSRCKNKGLQCKFDSNFKRIPMRRVAQDITNELHQLISAKPPAKLDESQSKGPAPTDAFVSPTGITYNKPATEQQTSHTAAQILGHATIGDGSWLQLTENDYYSSYPLGSVSLDGDTAFALMKHFERHYLQHSPFLARIDSISTLSVRSPLLFWTIVLVASREHIQFEGIYEQICSPHGLLLSQLMQSAILDIEGIHALLLLCLWPVPRHREKNDPSWDYIGLAINAAMQLSCHNPSYAFTDIASWKGLGSYERTPEQVGSELMAATWIYCFQIGSRLASYTGLPPPLATNAQLRSVTKATAIVSSNVTHEEVLMTEILRLSCLSTSEVDYADEPQIRFSLIQMFDAQFDSLYQPYSNQYSPKLDITLLSSKLYLYGLMMAVEGNGLLKTHQQINNERLILLRLRDAAFKLIARMTQLSDTPVEDGLYPAGVLSFYPKHYFTSLHMAAVSLFRFLASYQGLTQSETASALDGIADSHKILQSFTEHRDAIRAAGHIQWLVEIIRNRYSTSRHPLDRLVITGRLGASIHFDALFRATEYRNRDPDTGASRPISDWVPMTNDPRHHLPDTPDHKVYNSKSTSHHSGADDVQPKGQMMAAWDAWDIYMNDFALVDSWSNEIIAQLDPATQAQMYDVQDNALLPVHDGT